MTVHTHPASICALPHSHVTHTHAHTVTLTLQFEASFVAVGFLYDLYEPHAFMYMVAELLRRLVLCCLVVFINTEHQVHAVLAPVIVVGIARR